MDEKIIVDKIKALRLARDMSLQNLADRAGLTKGYLSRIENSKKAPPVSTLANIAKALDIDITEFFNQNGTSRQSADIAITRKNESLKIGGRGTPFGYVYDALAHQMPGKNMVPYILTIKDEIYDYDHGFRHEGEEFIYILEGKMEHYYGGETYILEKGDSAYFNSGIPHYGKSIGTKRAKILCIIYSYKRL